MLFWLIFFFLLFPIAININFLHNDDAFYYLLINKFLGGDFTLEPTTAPSFYTVGILGMTFASIFGLGNLPVLTLFVSISSLFIFSLILVEYFRLRIFDAILLSLLLFVNPLFIFTSIGFMTDNYFLLFMLLSFYFLLKVEMWKRVDLINLTVGNIFIIVAYFARQIGLVTSIAFAVYFWLKKKYKLAIVQTIIFILLAVYHFKFFPKTGEMLETKFIYSNLTYFRHIFTTTYAMLIHITAYLIPLFIILLSRKIKRDFKLIMLLLVSVPLIIYLGSLYFNPLGWIGERFYYLKYTVSRSGFYKEAFSSDSYKSSFYYHEAIYLVWDVVSKILLISSVIVLFIRSRYEKIFNVFLIYFAGYILLMNISVKLYDRYLIPLIPIVIFMLLKEMKLKFKFAERAVLSVFILVLGFYSYNYATEYIFINNYAWVRAEEISQMEKISPDQISVTPAWRHLYGERDPRIYKFGYSCGEDGVYDVYEVKEIKHPLNFWENSIFYLCKLRVE